jgi:hypothetical protein
MKVTGNAVVTAKSRNLLPVQHRERIELLKAREIMSIPKRNPAKRNPARPNLILIVIKTVGARMMRVRSILCADVTQLYAMISGLHVCHVQIARRY